jgi:hypothetical protein
VTQNEEVKMTVTMSKKKEAPLEDLLKLNFFLNSCKKFITASDIFELKKFVTKYCARVDFSQEEMST